MSLTKEGDPVNQGQRLDGARLRQLRKARGLKQREFDVDERTVRRAELGKPVTRYVRQTLARGLGVQEAELLPRPPAHPTTQHHEAALDAMRAALSHCGGPTPPPIPPAVARALDALRLPHDVGPAPHQGLCDAFASLALLPASADPFAGILDREQAGEFVVTMNNPLRQVLGR